MDQIGFTRALASVFHLVHMGGISGFTGDSLGSCSRSGHAEEFYKMAGLFTACDGQAQGRKNGRCSDISKTTHSLVSLLVKI
jgi:hypothetical protein